MNKKLMCLMVLNTAISTVSFAQVTDEQVKEYINNFQGNYSQENIQTIKDAAAAHGVSAEQIDAAMGFQSGTAANAFNSLNQPAAAAPATASGVTDEQISDYMNAHSGDRSVENMNKMRADAIANGVSAERVDKVMKYANGTTAGEFKKITGNNFDTVEEYLKRTDTNSKDVTSNASNQDYIKATTASALDAYKAAKEKYEKGQLSKSEFKTIAEQTEKAIDYFMRQEKTTTATASIASGSLKDVLLANISNPTKVAQIVNQSGYKDAASLAAAIGLSEADVKNYYEAHNLSFGAGNADRGVASATTTSDFGSKSLNKVYPNGLGASLDPNGSYVKKDGSTGYNTGSKAWEYSPYEGLYSKEDFDKYYYKDGANINGITTRSIERDFKVTDKEKIQEIYQQIQYGFPISQVGDPRDWNKILSSSDPLAELKAQNAGAWKTTYDPKVVYSEDHGVKYVGLYGTLNGQTSLISYNPMYVKTTDGEVYDNTNNVVSQLSGYGISNQEIADVAKFSQNAALEQATKWKTVPQISGTQYYDGNGNYKNEDYTSIKQEVNKILSSSLTDSQKQIAIYSKADSLGFTGTLMDTVMGWSAGQTDSYGKLAGLGELKAGSNPTAGTTLGKAGTDLVWKTY